MTLLIEPNPHQWTLMSFSELNTYYNKKTTQASTKNTSWLFGLEVHLKLVWFMQEGGT